MRSIWTGEVFLCNSFMGKLCSLADVSFGVKPIIQQSEHRTYTKVVPFKDNSSFRFVVL